MTFFSPPNVAVIGATDKRGSVGRTVLLNLASGPFAKRIYAIKTKRNAGSWPSFVSQGPNCLGIMNPMVGLDAGFR